MSKKNKIKIDRIRYIIVSFLIDDRKEMVERKVKLTNMLDPMTLRLNDYVNEIYNNENFVIDDTVGIAMNAVYCEAIED